MTNPTSFTHWSMMSDLEQRFLCCRSKAARYAVNVVMWVRFLPTQPLNMPFKNKEARTEYLRKRRAKAIDYIIELKSRPCFDCKQTFPWYVMEFDHVPERGPKTRNVTQALAGNKKAIDKEVSKCDIVCGNCHNIRTYNRGQQRGYSRGS